MCFAEERIFPMKPEVNWKQVQVVAFDLFGTVFKLDRPRRRFKPTLSILRSRNGRRLCCQMSGESWRCLRMRSRG